MDIRLVGDGLLDLGYGSVTVLNLAGQQKDSGTRCSESTGDLIAYPCSPARDEYCL